jgi:hypothetical protein
MPITHPADSKYPLSCTGRAQSVCSCQSTQLKPHHLKTERVPSNSLTLPSRFIILPLLDVTARRRPRPRAGWSAASHRQEARYNGPYGGFPYSSPSSVFSCPASTLPRSSPSRRGMGPLMMRSNTLRNGGACLAARSPKNKHQLPRGCSADGFRFVLRACCGTSA